MMSTYFLSIILAMYSISVQLLNESPWYELLLCFSVIIPVVPSFAACTAATVYFGFKGVVDYLLEAWKDFTVDIERGGVPDDAPFEGV